MAANQLTYDVPTTEILVNSEIADAALFRSVTPPVQDAGESDEQRRFQFGTALAAAATGIVDPPGAGEEAEDVLNDGRKKIKAVIRGENNAVNLRVLRHSADWMTVSHSNERHVHSARLRAIERAYRFSVSEDNLASLPYKESLSALFVLFGELVKTAMSDAQPDDHICVIFRQATIKELFYPGAKKKNWDYEMCWQSFVAVLASKDQWTLDASFELVVYILGAPVGTSDSTRSSSANGASSLAPTNVSLPSSSSSRAIPSTSRLSDLNLRGHDDDDDDDDEVAVVGNEEDALGSSYVALSAVQRARVETDLLPLVVQEDDGDDDDDDDDDDESAASSAEEDDEDEHDKACNSCDDDNSDVWVNVPGTSGTSRHHPLRSVARRVLRHTQSAVDPFSLPVSRRVRRARQLNSAARAELAAAEGRRHNVKRRRRDVGESDETSIADTVRRVGRDCLVRALVGGITRQVVQMHASDLSIRLQKHINAMAINELDAHLPSSIKTNTRRLLNKCLDEIDKFGNCLTQAPSSKIRNLIRIGGVDAKNILRPVTKNVLAAIYKSRGYERFIEYIISKNIASNGDYQPRHIVNIISSVQARMDRLHRAYNCGSKTHNVDKIWGFVFPNGTRRNIKASAYLFDGQRLDSVQREITSGTDIHLQLLFSFRHVWILNRGISPLENKCPTLRQRCPDCGNKTGGAAASKLTHTCSYRCNRCHEPTCKGRLYRCGGDFPGAARGVEPPLPANIKTRHCRECGRTFLDGQCFLNHRTGAPNSICLKLRLCETCGVLLDLTKRQDRKHVCFQKRCTICNARYDSRAIAHHLCYMRRIGDVSPAPKLRESECVCFDCETMYDPTTCVMRPVLICVGRMSEDGTGNYEDLATFRGYRCFRQFAHWVVANLHNVCLVAHNGARFDSLWLLSELELAKIAVQLVRAPGGALIQIVILANKVKICDSYRLCQMKLDSMVKSFVPANILATVAGASKKSPFPYKYGTTTNYDRRIIKHPLLEHYEPERKYSQREREELEKWYAENIEPKRLLEEENDTESFDFHSELEQYCRLDVILLSLAVYHFRMAVRELAFGIDPFSEVVTTASLALRAWRKEYLSDNTVAVFQETTGKLSSEKADLYLAWIEKTEAPNLVARVTTKREMMVYGYNKTCYWLDGYDPSSRRAYSFLGCFFHGCPVCYPTNRDKLHPFKQKSYQALYEYVIHRQEAILANEKDRVVNFTVLWEHQLDEMIADESLVDFQAFCVQFKSTRPPPLIERDALFGGRTELFISHLQYCEQWPDCDTTEDCRSQHNKERLVYIDFTSAYPFVQGTKPLPVGHGELLTPQSIDEVFLLGEDGAWSLRAEYKMSIVFGRFLPPRNLYAGVLPYRRQDKKVLWPLCRTCVEMSGSKDVTDRAASRGQCSHDDESARWLEGTWCSPEVEKALERGYVPIAVFHVKYFAPINTSCAPFRHYTRHFFEEKLKYSKIDREFQLSLKREDPTITSEEIERRYIEKIGELSGLMFPGEPIILQPGMQEDLPRRTLAKLLLNSLWGKLAERQTLQTQAVFDDFEALLDLLDNKHIFLSSLTLGYSIASMSDPDYLVEMHNSGIADSEDVAPDSVAVTYGVRDAMRVGSNRGNVVIAAFVTAYARLMLYDVLERVGERVYYIDTDSAFVEESAVGELQDLLENGFWLGQMKNETDGDLIVAFSGLGPKSYMYRKESGAESRAMKGISQTLDACNSITFDSVTALINHVREHGEDPEDHDPPVIAVNQHVITRHSVHRALLHSQDRVKHIRDTHTKRFRPPGSYRSYPYGFRFDS